MPEVTRGSKNLVRRFAREAVLGKTVVGRAKKKIGAGRVNKYVTLLSNFARFVKKDLDAVDTDDMEAFILALEHDQLRSNKARNPEGILEASYKRDQKVTIRKFYKWLLGENKVFPKLVEWIDTYDEPREVPALTEAEVALLIDYASHIHERALIQILFDSGFRIGELLNVRLENVRFIPPDPATPERKCFFIRAPYSKTLPRTVVTPMPETTKWLTLWLKEHPAHPQILEDGNLGCARTQDQLFPYQAERIRNTLTRIGEKALQKRVYPHLLRHTSATFWANRLSHYKLCKRFGWNMTSTMPQRYIDRQGIDETETAQIYYQTRPETAKDVPCDASLQRAAASDHTDR